MMPLSNEGSLGHGIAGDTKLISTTAVSSAKLNRFTWFSIIDFFLMWGKLFVCCPTERVLRVKK